MRCVYTLSGLSKWLSGKESACNAGTAGDAGLILGWEDPLEKGNGYPPQHFCLETPMDRGAWRATVHGVTKSWTEHTQTTHTYIYLLRDFLCLLYKLPLYNWSGQCPSVQFTYLLRNFNHRNHSTTTEVKFLKSVKVGKAEIKGSRNHKRDFPGGPVVKNTSCNAGDKGSIPGRGTKIPHA